MTKNKVTKKSGASLGRVATVAAIGAGAYHFLGPNGKKNQKQVKDWFENTKNEIVQKAKPIIKDVKKMARDMDSKKNDIKKKIKSASK